jgi:hypothetical protein
MRALALIALFLALLAVPAMGQVYAIPLPEDNFENQAAGPEVFSLASIMGDAPVPRIIISADQAKEEVELIMAMLVERYPLDQYEVIVTPMPAHPLTTSVEGFAVKVVSVSKIRSSFQEFYGFPFYGIFLGSYEVKEIVEKMEMLEALGAERVLYNGPAMKQLWEQLNVTSCNNEGCWLLPYDIPELQCLFDGALMIWQGSEFPERYAFTRSINERDLSEEDVAEVLPEGFTFLLESEEEWLTIFSPQFLLPETGEELMKLKSSFNQELDEYQIIPELRF